ncbi:MAG: hypothetical protein HY788_22355 [Deltaproteobacteria bacterium]|nr:hypothetical protein [Deltaproteobacteria bacterium]
MSIEARPKMPVAQIVFGEIVYWITVLSCLICTVGPLLSIAFPDNNVMNPHYLFASIWKGNSSDVVWKEVGGAFPGGHFYFDHLTKGDGFTQFGLALGCSVALWGLIGTAIAYFRERVYLYVVLSLWVGALVALAMVGIVGLH